MKKMISLFLMAALTLSSLHADEGEDLEPPSLELENVQEEPLQLENINQEEPLQDHVLQIPSEDEYVNIGPHYNENYVSNKTLRRIGLILGGVAVIIVAIIAVNHDQGIEVQSCK